MNKLSVVVPIYNEASTIVPFLERLEPVLEEMEIQPEIIFCLDPSQDNTEAVVKDQIERNPNIRLIVFSRRFGQPAATMAGIRYSSGDACVIIDVDLQDPPELIPKLYDKYLEGFDVVYATRVSRRGETVIKKLVSVLGYKVINRLSDVRIPENTGDFRIISRRVINHLNGLKETHGFLRGLVAYVGFNQTAVEYEREPRADGQGKYNRLTGSLRIGLNGLVGFSSKPLQLMSALGFFLASLSFVFGLYFVVRKLTGSDFPDGFTTLILAMSFFAGLQLFGLGLTGEYISRIYDEAKGRPPFIVDKEVNFHKDDNA